MDAPFEFSFPHYLAAKKSVDDRALNRSVWAKLAQAVAAIPPERPLHVLEAGAGIGSMIERCEEWGLWAGRTGPVHYTAVDEQADNIHHARQRLTRWAENRDVQVEIRGPEGSTPGPLHLHAAESPPLHVTLHPGDIFDYAAAHPQAADLLIAHAVLDLLDLPTALPRLLGALRAGGLCYFTINFDGVTGFLPVVDAALDAQIERLYHRSMDERRINSQPAGHSQTGRRLFHALPAAGVALQAAGASDWVVHSVGDAYPQEEAYFLRCILHFVADTLLGHPDLDQAAFRRWLETRQAQIEQGELVYFAHQFDFFGSLP